MARIIIVSQTQTGVGVSIYFVVPLRKIAVVVIVATRRSELTRLREATCLRTKMTHHRDRGLPSPCSPKHIHLSPPPSLFGAVTSDIEHLVVF
jgi:hypothetical protein